MTPLDENDRPGQSDGKGLARRIRQHVAGKPHRFFAVVQPGFEETARRELESLGIERFTETTRGGLEFEAKLTDCYRINLCSRTLTRVVMRLASFSVTRFSALRQRIGHIPWELYLAPAAPVSFNTTCHNSRLYHTGRIDDECFRGIRDRLADFGMEPVVSDLNDRNRCQTIFIRFADDVCHVSLDASGEPLYRRGYKQLVADAPLRETLASLIAMEARASDYDMIIDPMTGSGTFAIEAAMMRAGIAPGARRNFIFETWPAFRAPAFAHMKKSLEEKHAAGFEDKCRILCADIDETALSIARKNSAAAGVEGLITFEKRDFFCDIYAIPEGKRALILLNPPYGKRIGSAVSALDGYRLIGDTIRRNYRGCGYAIIVPGAAAEEGLAIPFEKKIPFDFGGLSVQLIIKY